jgi:hypothetical protein
MISTTTNTTGMTLALLPLLHLKIPTHKSEANTRKSRRRSTSSHCRYTSPLGTFDPNLACTTIYFYLLAPAPIHPKMPIQKPNAAKANTAKAKTRAERGGSTTTETQQDINDEIEGRAFLEKHLLLCPTGDPVTHNSLATCLHQVSAMQGVTKLVMNAIRAVA